MIHSVVVGAVLVLIILVAIALVQRERRRLRSARTTLARLTESEERLAAALRGADDGVWDWNVVTDTRWYSPRWWGMLGYEPNEFPADGAVWRRLIHPQQHDRIAAWLAGLLASDVDNYTFEVELLNKSGHYVPVLARGYIERDANGKAVRLSGTLTDLTERRRIATERDQFEKKLQETQKLESLGVLAGGIAHDFNNLLTGVLGNASLAMNDLPEGSRTHTYLVEINDAAMRAAELCRQMLAYSGRGRFVVGRVALNGLIEQTVQLLQLSISKNATLRFQLEPKLPMVEVDATQVRQVIMNLVINASEALGDKSGVITVSTGTTRVDEAYLREVHLASALEAGEYVHLEVADTASGMTPDVLARIFEPFYTTKFTGRGLGLAAVLGIMRGHRGTLKVYSEPGRGSTFKLLFPVAPGASEEPVAPAASVPWKGSGTVLVVDDEPSVRRTVSRMLALMGFTSIEAVDGADAIEIYRARSGEISMVMLDLTMPRMNGEETFAELRRIQPSVRVVLMSGFNQHEAVARFAGKGLANFLQKPFAVETLRDAVQNVVN
ncbi:MAG: hybrid sensor histidine kinase/response regulator [Gemmatimonas sp.]